jgi:guanylate kinase
MLSGSSGVGKNTLINELRKEDKNIILMPTLTTRSKRKNEVEGDPYYYLTKEEFNKKINDDELFEHEHMHGNLYGSSKIIFKDYINKGNILIKDIGVEGAYNLSNILKDYTPTIKVFLTTRTKCTLVKRLKGRGELRIKKRLRRYPYEQAQKSKFDFLILNNNKEQTKKLLFEIMNNSNSIKNVVFTKPLDKLKDKKIKKYIQKFKKGKFNPYVKVMLKDSKIILLNSHEKFVASIIAKKNLCKKVVNKKSCKQLNKNQSRKWKNYIRKLLKTKSNEKAIKK